METEENIKMEESSDPSNNDEDFVITKTGKETIFSCAQCNVSIVCNHGVSYWLFSIGNIQTKPCTYFFNVLEVLISEPIIVLSNLNCAIILSFQSLGSCYPSVFTKSFYFGHTQIIFLFSGYIHKIKQH